jgi:hypothetical protein
MLASPKEMADIGNTNIFKFWSSESLYREMLKMETNVSEELGASICRVEVRM